MPFRSYLCSLLGEIQQDKEWLCKQTHLHLKAKLNLSTNHILVFLCVLGGRLSALRFSPGYVVGYSHCTETTPEIGHKSLSSVVELSQMFRGST